jgi:hypothetical protein
MMMPVGIGADADDIAMSNQHVLQQHAPTISDLRFSLPFLPSGEFRSVEMSILES